MSEATDINHKDPVQLNGLGETPVGGRYVSLRWHQRGALT